MSDHDDEGCEASEDHEDDIQHVIKLLTVMMLVWLVAVVTLGINQQKHLKAHPQLVLGIVIRNAVILIEMNHINRDLILRRQGDSKVSNNVSFKTVGSQNTSG